MEASKESAILAKMKTLTPVQLAEVEDFVSFLTTKSLKQNLIDDWLSIAADSEAAGLPPLTEEEVAAEIEAYRREKRQSGENSAPRS